MPNEPTICAAMRVACARSPPGPVPDSPKNSSSAVMPPNAIFIEPSELGTGARVALLVVGVREQTERVAALDDRQHLELAVLARRGRRPTACPASCVAIVRFSSSVYSTGCFRPISSVIFACCTSRQSIGVAAVAQRPHERFVEEVLDHHRRVPEGHRGEHVAALFLVELGNVRLLVEVVVDDLAPAGAGRHVEVDRAVEPTRTQQRGVEVGGAVGRADHQDVRRAPAASSSTRRCAGSQRLAMSIERAPACGRRSSAGRTTAAGSAAR